MIDRNKLKLEEITFEDYEKLHSFWQGHSGFKPKGYARIMEPLTSSDYVVLLAEFTETPFARRVRYKMKDGEWAKEVNRHTLKEPGAIERAALAAEEGGFIDLQFQGGGSGGVNHEISWQRVEPAGPLISIKAKIPGYLRREYGWNGSQTAYFMIGAVWVPENVAQDILKPASASPPADQSSRPDPGQ